jgi:hypothetical protein
MGALLSKVTLRVFAALAVIASCGLLGAEGAWAATTEDFTAVGDHSYTVPPGVTSITVTAVGAGGGNCPTGGGEGASITATVPVSPGEALVVAVAGPGGGCSNTPTVAGSAGFGGGGTGGLGSGSNGSGGAGGGGASVVAPGTSSPNFGEALVVAGGGGGAAGFGSTANGGNAGSPGSDGMMGADGGGAGAPPGGSGGAAGTGAQAGAQGSSETGGTGGNGATADSSVGGGGGGGGYYGGGGGGGGAVNENPGGGGGGSSYAVAGSKNVIGPTPTSSAAEVTITPTFTIAPTATISSPASGGTYSQGQRVYTTWSCAEAAGGPGLTSCTDSNGTTRVESGGKGHLDTSTLGTFTYTVTAISHDGLVGKASITYTVVPSRVKVASAKISSTKHTAKFAFKAVGQAPSFQCALVKQNKHRKQPKASFSSCHSPKLYKHLKAGKYTFEVRSVSAGIHGPPAEKRFTIT